MTAAVVRWLVVLLIAFIGACGIKVTLEHQEKVIFEGPKHKTPEQEKEDTPEAP